MAQIKLAQFRPIHAPTKEKIASFDSARYKGKRELRKEHGRVTSRWKSNFGIL